MEHAQGRYQATAGKGRNGCLLRLRQGVDRTKHEGDDTVCARNITHDTRVAVDDHLWEPLLVHGEADTKKRSSGV
jgi:hypothetical protein